MPHEEYHDLFFSAINFIYGSVVPYSYLQKVSRNERFPTLIGIACEFYKLLLDSLFVHVINFLECLRSFRVQKHFVCQVKLPLGAQALRGVLLLLGYVYAAFDRIGGFFPVLHRG